MAKTIKFNLTCDKASIRTLDDLREHFCVQDVFGYYESGLLARWLEVHDYKDELNKLLKIEKKDSAESKLSQIASIFEIDDKENVKKNLRIFEYECVNNQKYEMYATGKNEEKDVLNSYQERYDNLVNEIISHKDDYVAIKSAVEVLIKDFSWMISIDFERLFYRMVDSAPLALFCFITKKELRELYLPIRIVCDGGETVLDTLMERQDPVEKRYYAHKKNMYKKLCALTSVSMKEILGDNLKIFSDNTDEYWKDIEPDANKKFLILSMSNDCLVRSLNNKGEELRNTDINNKFVILKGIDFKNKYNHTISYMEV